MSKQDKNLGMSHAGEQFLLLKVPKCIKEKWSKCPSNTNIGEFCVSETAGENKATLSLTDAVMNLDPEEKIPKEYVVEISEFGNQSLGVFSQAKTPEGSVEQDISLQSVSSAENFVIEGHVWQKLDVKPKPGNDYMRMKLDSIRKTTAPARTMQRIDKVVQNFKPIADHAHNIEYRAKKKSEGKMMRDDKDSVMYILFNAFEKHQFYNIKDLVQITKQPIVYLKEILKEFCQYNAKNPHKNMWELKKEYRHYKAAEKKDDGETD